MLADIFKFLTEPSLFDLPGYLVLGLFFIILPFCSFWVFCLSVSIAKILIERKRRKKFIRLHPDHVKVSKGINMRIYSVNGELPAIYKGKLYVPTGEVTIRADHEEYFSEEMEHVHGEGRSLRMEFEIMVNNLRYLSSDTPQNSGYSFIIQMDFKKDLIYSIYSARNCDTVIVQASKTKTDKPDIYEFPRTPASEFFDDNKQ